MVSRTIEAEFTLRGAAGDELYSSIFGCGQGAL
jgi:hypothetical protein